MAVNAFVDAMATNDVVGENGMPAHSTSGPALLDWFFMMGASRKLGEPQIVQSFKAAFEESPLLALKSLFYLRDVRGGLGERRVARVVLTWLAKNQSETLQQNLHLMPIFGRWDDLEQLQDSELADDAYGFWAAALTEDGLAAKWAPRKGPIAYELASVLGLSPKQYRQLVVSQSKTVEQLMSAQRWDDIDFEHVPSQAALMYRKAFAKRQPERYQAYVEAVKAGHVTIQAKTLMPHQIVEKVWQGEDGELLEQLWKAIPDVFEGKQRSILPVADVSGSMMGQPMMVSIALAIYLSERNKGTFKDVVVTFSESPSFLYLGKWKTLRAKVVETRGADWGMNTNLEKTFAIMLQRAVEAKLPAADMPDTILIMSDMQFDHGPQPNQNALQIIQQQYESSGYSMPRVVFWNLRASVGIPAKASTPNVALVSGFSPNVMKGVLQGVTSPEAVMLQTLNSKRYEAVTI